MADFEQWKIFCERVGRNPDSSVPSDKKTGKKT